MAFDLDDEELRATRKLNGVEWEEDKEIQVGDFVRTKDEVIAKIIQEIEEDYEERGNVLYELDKETYDDTEGFEEYSYFALPDQFKKHSPNLIDLIEVGDYVNGYRVVNVINEEPCPSGKCVDIDSAKQSEDCTLWEDDIKTIVTHQQFNSVMYKVKE